VAHPHHTYQPRDTDHSVLHAVIREHLEPFLREASDRGDGHGLPRFVEHEFREFLTCGVLAGGFMRLRCADCAFERLLPFSCKRRGFCPSWGGRRMAERAAYLVDEVLPRVPVRQWVLTLPSRLRYRLAWDHARCRAVLGVYARVLLAFLPEGPLCFLCARCGLPETTNPSAWAAARPRPLHRLDLSRRGSPRS